MTPALGTVFPERIFAGVGLDQVRRYAALSGDDNPIHVDPEAARSVGLAEPVIQGMLLMGLADTALAGWLPEARVAKLSTRFALPVPVGADVAITGRVVKVDASGATLRILIKDGTGRMVAMAEAVVA